jgi:prolipoprotein diacylglyceryltransferase
MGTWIGLTLAERRAHRYALNGDLLFNLALVGILAGVLGARLAYLARYPAAFAQNPWDVFSRNPGLLDPLGGLTVGLLAAAVYARRKKMLLWNTLDALTPALAVFFLALGAANLASGDAYGAPSSLPWSIELWGAARHPAQIYAILAAGAILVIVLSKRLPDSFAGVYFLRFAALTAASHLFLEYFRGDSYLLPGGWRAAQWIAWLALAASLYGLILLKKQNQAPRETKTANGHSL